MREPQWQPPPAGSFRPSRPELNLAGVGVPLPFWLLASFVLLFAVPGLVTEYRLAHDQGGLAGTVTVTLHNEPAFRRSTDDCRGTFRPANAPTRTREVQVLLTGECRIGAALPARTCPDQAFGYRDGCKRFAWTKGVGEWKSMLGLVSVFGTIWTLLGAVMVTFFFKWRRAKRRAALASPSAP